MTYRGGAAAPIPSNRLDMFHGTQPLHPAKLLQTQEPQVNGHKIILAKRHGPCRIGRAIAALLSLPIKPEGSNKDACLNNLKNKVIYVNSFSISQKEMLASVCRVTGTKESDWSISKEPSHERYNNGLKEMKEGKMIGFAKMMYTRVFYPDGCGDFEHNKGTLNSMLGLPKEDIDEATEVAIERAKSGGGH